MEPNLLHPSGSFPELSSHIMESLFFSMSVYEPTKDAVLQDLQIRLGKVQPLMYYGFEEDDKQSILVARSPTGRVIVACRGTAGFRDIVQDLKYIQSRLSFVKGGAAHWGFAERAESVPIDFFCKLLGAGEEVIFTGHSLGGAVASLLCLRVLESSKGLYDEQVHCITFGCPLFASCRLAELINSNYKEVFTHIVSRRDVVPKLLPFIATLQRLAYADEDHLEGLLVLKNVLSLLPGVPLASLISGIERRVPSLLKVLFRGFMKLAFPSGRTGSYAFAGHVVMLDTEGPVERSFELASADDMNVWHSQLGFAFGAGFDVAMIEQHMLEYYHNGILRSLSQVRMRRETPISGPFLKSSRIQDYARLDSSLQMINQATHCTDNVDSGQYTARKGLALDGKPQQQSLLIRFIPPEGDHSMDCKIQFRCDPSDGESSSSIVVTQNARHQEGRDCGGSSAERSGTEDRSSLARTMSDGEHAFVQSRGRSKAWRLQRSMSSGCSNSAVWAYGSEQRKNDTLVRTKEITVMCRACAHLRMHMNITTCCHKAPKRRLGFGWLLGTIGRVARHLRVLDNLCYLTFVRMLVANLVA